MSIKVTGLGGCKEVGRSCFLVDAEDKILLERGLKLTPEETQYPLPVKKSLDAVIISHAHLDHSGDLPHLFTKNSPVAYMTPPTLDLAELLWHDSLKIARIEGFNATFSKNEIRRARRYSFPMGYKTKLDISNTASIEFFNAGHIVGSAITQLCLKEKSLVYTGDFRTVETRLLKKADLPKEADFVITESTYGDSDHEDRQKVEREFVDACNEVVDNGGFAIVPAFAVGRSHELIDVLAERKVKHRVYLDGMAQKAARLTLKYPEYLKNPKALESALKNSHWVKKEKERKRVLDEPCIIVTTAGMCEGGPVMNYIKRLHKDKKSAILLTGYQVKETQGRRLIEKGKITIDGKEYAPKNRIEKFDFSAHAGQTELMQALKKWSPSEVLMVHGEPQKMQDFKEKIKEDLGIPAKPLEAGKTIEMGEK